MGQFIAGEGRVTAVLGATNTGKTHYAIERMLAHRSGVIGLPLRLLAREVYDRIVAQRGPSVVALLTGEERRVPPRAQYWVCTVEAMPEGLGADFLAIDEIQLCADPARGHVFTNRLLHARGLHETLFLGAETMRSVIAQLLPGVRFLHRARFSELTYTGSKKISRMPPRAAIVGFSVENLYAVAELIRRQKGGAAVVMGALSPRTRNAQVALYQSGEVDYLVATDAIGMGLNLDIDHVAFSARSKFDGRRMRPLSPPELAQIAGRAGRYMRPGSFGVTGEALPLDEAVAEAISNNEFPAVEKLTWRNGRLEFGTLGRLIAALEAHPEDRRLQRGRAADDLMALKALGAWPEILDQLRQPQDIRRLWDVCRIPDFRGISGAEHAALLAQIFGFVENGARVPDEWLVEQIGHIDRVDGGIDMLSRRLAHIRTWTYVAQRAGWVHDENHWRGVTRAIEDRLSDALHGALTQRFVDRRTSVLLRRLKQKEGLVAKVSESGDVTVEDQFVGRLEGFRFSLDKSASPEQAKTLRQAALAALKPEFHLRADRFYNAPDTEIDFTDQGGLMWGVNAIGKLIKGSDTLKPQVVAFVDDDAGPEIAEKVRRRLQHFTDRKVATQFAPLFALQNDDTLTGLARGFGFRLIEALGVLARDKVAQEVKELDQDARAMLRKHGIRFGQFTIFMPLLLKPAPTRLRLVLWAIAQDLAEFPASPPPGLVTIVTDAQAPAGWDMMSGYRAAGARAIRIDMLERLADMLRAENSRSGFEGNADMLSITGTTLDQFADLMQGLGYKAVKGERIKVKAPGVEPKTAPSPNFDSEGGASDSMPSENAGSPEVKPAEAAPENVTENMVEDVTENAPEDTSENAAKTVAENTPESVAQEPQNVTSDGSGHLQHAKPLTDEAPEMEAFYTFTWARPRAPARSGTATEGARDGHPERKTRGKPAIQRAGKEPGKRPRPSAKPPRENKPKTYQARPEKRDRIDPDNPFAAALMGLRDKK